MKASLIPADTCNIFVILNEVAVGSLAGDAVELPAALHITKAAPTFHPRLKLFRTKSTDNQK